MTSRTRPRPGAILRGDGRRELFLAVAIDASGAASTSVIEQTTLTLAASEGTLRRVTLPACVIGSLFKTVTRSRRHERSKQ